MSKIPTAVSNIVSNISSHYQSSSIPKPSSSQPPQFFEHTKKGEVNELKQLLKNTLNEKDQNKRRDVVKKVIAFMTLGIDVSRLFSEMCMASFTSDLIQKKMIYLYLGNYAESHPDLAIMAMNTFLKDCQHADPKIRGLALRSLCSMRFSGSSEYMEPAILEALKDTDPYVRKTAVMGCIKLCYLMPSKVKKSSIIDSLYALIKDNDPLVITNAIQALNEILQDEGGIAISTKMVVYLLNRVKEFSEWGQTIILELVGRYVPKSENELYDIMNLLEDRLKHSCTSIVLGCIKVFLNFTLDKPQLHQQVFKRIQSPLITLMTSGEVIGTYELTFTALSHIYFIVTRGGNSVFENDYKQFYCKVDEPTYIKLLKLDILTQIASENNLGDILNELGEYVTDIDVNIARKSIQALGGIAIRLPKMATPIVKQLTTFIAMQSEHVTNETVIAFRDILRKYPGEYKEIIQVINNSLDNITEEDSKIALMWILGDFGEAIEDSPYILETFINLLKDSKSGESTGNTKVKHTLLTACVKLFLKRPPEMQLILGSLFNLILSNEKEDVDLKDRAAFYYRIMQANIEELSKTMGEARQEISMFLEDEENSKENTNIEFNTLSVIYQKPSSKFIKSFEHFNIQRNKELAIMEAASKIKQEEVTQDEAKKDTETQPEPPVEKADDLLDVDVPTSTKKIEPSSSAFKEQSQNLLDLNFGPSMTSISVADLAEGVEIDSEFFQSSWMGLHEGATLTRVLKSNVITNMDPQYVEALFSKFRVNCIASGQMEGEMKFYFFSKHVPTDKFIFLECQLNKVNNILNLNVKCEDDELAAFFSKYIESVFISNGFI